MSGIEANCYRRINKFNITYIVSPSLIGNFQSTMKLGGGSDQNNDADFLEAHDGTIVGAICETSEGIALYNANDPAHPYILGTYDASLAEGSYEAGATYCSAGTDGLTWWFQQADDNSICAVQLLYGPASINSGASLFVFEAFVSFLVAFLAMQWN